MILGVVCSDKGGCYLVYVDWGAVGIGYFSTCFFNEEFTRG